MAAKVGFYLLRESEINKVPLGAVIFSDSLNLIILFVIHFLSGWSICLILHFFEQCSLPARYGISGYYWDFFITEFFPAGFTDWFRLCRNN